MAGLAGNTRSLNPLLKLRNLSHLYTLCSGFVTALSHDCSSKPEGTRQSRIHAGGGRYRPDAFFAILPDLCLRGREYPLNARVIVIVKS